MHVRMTMAEGITDRDKTAALLGDNVLPALRDQRGFVGLNASLDPATGSFTAISLWETEADLQASAAAADTQRNDFAAAIGGRITEVRGYELAVMDVATTPPGPGSFVVIVRGSMDPANVEANLEFFKANVLPAAQAADGYRAVRNMVDRQKGETAVGIVFADRSSADAWVKGSAERRGQAQSRGIELGTPTVREVIFTS